MTNRIGSFFTRLREKFFKRRIDGEIFDRIFPHHRGDTNNGYPFNGRKEMNAQTEQLDVQAVFDTIEQHIGNMPDAYGESFRYIMHRDLHKRLLMYERLAKRRVRRQCDPRFVATRFALAQ